MPIRIEGLDNIVSKLDSVYSKRLIQDFLDSVGKVALDEMIKRAKGSLKEDVQLKSGNSTTEVGIMASEGTGLWYKARAKEYGTGRVGDKTVSHKSSHWPPAQALALWARARGLNEYVVARIIGRRGGLMPDPYIRPSFDVVKSKIGRMIDELGKNIQSRW